MLSRPHINYQYWQQPMRNTLPQVSFVQRMDPSHPTTFVSTRSTIENSLGAFPGDNQIHCAQGYSSPDPTMLVLDPYRPSSHWVEVSSGGPMDTTFTANPSVPWLTVSPKDGKIAADGSTERKCTSRSIGLKFRRPLPISPSPLLETSTSPRPMVQ